MLKSRLWDRREVAVWASVGLAAKGGVDMRCQHVDDDSQCRFDVFEGAVGGKAISAEAFAHLFTREHRSLLLAAVRMLEDIAGKLVVEPLGVLRDLDWERTPPAVPDRRQSATAQNTSSELATETSRTPSR